MLRPGGILVVETPRYDTLTFKLLGHRERSVLCEGHVYFFTTSTLEPIAQKVGFSVLQFVWGKANAATALVQRHIAHSPRRSVGKIHLIRVKHTAGSNHGGYLINITSLAWFSRTRQRIRQGRLPLG